MSADKVRVMRAPQWSTIALVAMLIAVAVIVALNQDSCTDLRRKATETTDPARLWAIANAAESQARNDRFDFGDYNEDVFVCEGVAEYAAERAESLSVSG